MAALLPSATRPSWPAQPRRQERAEEVAQAGIGTINALAALGVEQGLTPEHSDRPGDGRPVARGVAAMHR